MHAGTKLHSYPLRTYDFSDGVYVIDALPPYQDLVGSRIIGVNDKSLAEVRTAVDPLISRDNSTTVKARFPTTMLAAEVLEGTGIISSERATFRFNDARGRSFERKIVPVPMGRYVHWIGHDGLWRLPKDTSVLYLQRPSVPAWVRYLRSSKIIYAQYNLVEDPSPIVSGIKRYMDRGAERVVLDIRNNPGGDNTQYGSLLEALSDPKVDRPGRLFVITGRTTFSAAGNLAGEVDARTQALFVGEPSGGAPNQFGDQQEIELPYSGITAFVAAYFVQTVPGDHRDSIRPEIQAPPTSSDFFEHVDPSMEAILRYSRSDA
jgi:hypothetical protein